MTERYPSSPVSEDQLIGQCMMEPDSTIFIACEQGVDKSWFYQTDAEKTFNVLLDLYVNQRPIGVPSVAERAKDLRVNIPLEYLQRCVDAVPIYNVQSVIDKLKEMYLRRAMLDESKWIKNFATIMDSPPEESIGHAICTLADYTETHRKMSKDQIRKEIVARYRAASQGGTAGVPTPWRTLNKTLGGLVQKQVTVFAGRGGIGKSQASATLVHFLGASGVPVAYLPFEDGLERTWARLGGIEGKYSTFRLDTGASEAECNVADKYLEHVMAYPIHMEDRPMTAEQVMAWAIHQKAKNGIQLLVIDAFKDLRRQSRDVAEDDAMSQTIAQIARRLDIPIWISHHVRKKDGGTSDDQRLTADDIRGSANIVNDARQLIVCQNWKDESDYIHFSFDVIKNNNGPCPVSIPMDRVSVHNYWREKEVQELEKNEE